MLAEYTELQQRIVSHRRKTFRSRALNSFTKRNPRCKEYHVDMESITGKDNGSSLELIFVLVFRKTSHNAMEWVRKSPGIHPLTAQKCQQSFLLTYHLFPAYPHMSPAQTLCCKPDSRENKEGVINSQELPQNASSRSIRAPCSSCLSSRQKQLGLHNLSLNNPPPSLPPSQLASKAFPWLSVSLLLTAAHQMGSSKEKQKINSSFLDGATQWKRSWRTQPFLQAPTIRKSIVSAQILQCR